MAWCSKWINGDDFPDGVEVTLNKDGNMRRYLPERTCKFVSSRGADYPPVCSECGYELGIYDCEWLDDGTYRYGGNYCPNCGARVIGADE